jgi:tetraacyldisaccharide 4'-kinase
VIEHIWYSQSLGARGLRLLLTPLSGLFRCGVAIRNFGYDLGAFHSESAPVPVLSVGNISVGGTGKTPVSAYFVQQLLARGYRPAIVMRGYGDDEPRVHATLTPEVPVYANPDRVAAITRAVEQGATAVVLDDAFQHRRLERDGDIVLVSAERWDQSNVLPAGPLREPRSALRRASLVIVTHKAASMSEVERVKREIHRIVPHIPVASMHLALDRLVSAHTDEALPLESLAGAQVLAIAGIGDSESFFAQLRAVGAIVAARSFPDHYAFSAEDAKKLFAEARDHKYVVTTLKDTVKLAPLWAPKAVRLWYVSQAVRVSSGEALIDATVNNIFPFREI